MANEGAQIVSFFGYDDAIELRNDHCEVVLTPSVGGKVMKFALDGKDVIMRVESERGYHYDPQVKDRFMNSGGRFDVGPVNIVARSPIQTKGAWEGKILGDRHALMVSQYDPNNGLQLEREVVLEADSPRVTLTHRMINRSNRVVRANHWSRVLAKGNGIGVVPATPPVFLPESYGFVHEGVLMMKPPKDEAIYRKDNFLVISGQPAYKKLQFDTQAGWYAYLLEDDLMIAQSFKVYPDEAYNDITNGNLCLYVNENLRGNAVFELEPISPQKTLQPGERAEFQETWYLREFPFPKDRKNFDLDAVSAAAME